MITLKRQALSLFFGALLVGTAFVVLTVSGAHEVQAQALEQAQDGPQDPLLTLDEAVEAARSNHPTLRRASADVDAAEASSDAARAPLLPQLRASAGYQLSAGDGYASSALDSIVVDQGVKIRHNLTFGVNATQLLWDFGGTRNTYRIARALAEAQAESAEMSLIDVVLNARLAYFTAGAARALAEVAAEDLANKERHLEQIEAYVETYLRPAIDLAKARADVADARLTLIQAENEYDLARVELNDAMGVGQGIDYDVDLDAGLVATDAEVLTTDVLLDEAIRTRPDVAALDDHLLAQQLRVDVAESERWPSLSLTTGFLESGGSFDDLVWNWYLGISLEWRFYQGGQVGAQIRQTEAELMGLQADRDLLVQSLRVEVEQARLAVRNNIAAVEAAEDTIVNAREQLRLAEGRYETGVGDVIELADAQLALTTSLVQRVRVKFVLAAARALLLSALGRVS